MTLNQSREGSIPSARTIRTPRLTGVGIRLLSGQKAGFDSQGVRHISRRSAALASISDCKSEMARSSCSSVAGVSDIGTKVLPVRLSHFRPSLNAFMRPAGPKAKGAFVSESALHIKMAVSRILSWMIIYLSDIPEDLCRTGCPPSVLSCTAWGFSCRPVRTGRGELLPRLFTLACLRKNSCSFKEPAVSFL